MLLIAIETDPAIVVVRLEGRLSDAGTRELVRVCEAATFRLPHQIVLFDLTGVSSIDGAGVAFLARAYRNGHSLVGKSTAGASASYPLTSRLRAHDGDFNAADDRPRIPEACRQAHQFAA